MGYAFHLGPDMRDPEFASYRDNYEAARTAWQQHARRNYLVA